MNVKPCVWSLNVEPDLLLKTNYRHGTCCNNNDEYIYFGTLFETVKRTQIAVLCANEELSKVYFSLQMHLRGGSIEYNISLHTLHTAVYLALNVSVLGNCMCNCV